MNGSPSRVQTLIQTGWSLSDGGRHFMKRSASAWAAEHAKDGVDPDVAAAAAEATFRMYTGEEPGPMG